MACTISMIALNKTSSMNSKKMILFLVTTVITGCGFFSKKVESIVEKAELKNKTATIKTTKKMLYCPDESKTQFIVEDDTTLKFYSPLFKSLLENRNYNFVQRSAMYSMMELLRRPDIVTPQARIQFYLRYKGKDTYLDVAPKTKDVLDSWSYIKGLEQLLKNSESSNNSDLIKLADLLDSSMPASINVSPAFELFLKKNRDQISKSEELTEVFFKGDEILTKHESFKKASLKKLIAKYKETKKYSENLYSINEFPLIDYKIPDSNLTAKCNIDINKETTTKDDLLENKIKKSTHYFAMMEGNNLFIATVSVFLPEKLGNLKGSYFFNTVPATSPLPICEFKSKGQNTVLFSAQGRFPSQHLRHLLTYEIGMADSQQTLQEILTFSRHLFLNNPDRILYESKRGRKAQLDFFLSMNFPIYHVHSLGDLIGASAFSSSAESSKSLIVDDRSNARLRCSF